MASFFFSLVFYQLLSRFPGKEQFLPIKSPTTSSEWSSEPGAGQSPACPLHHLPFAFRTLCLEFPLLTLMFPPTCQKCLRFCPVDGELWCIRIFRVHRCFVQLLATHPSLTNGCVPAKSVGNVLLVLLMLLFAATRLRPRAGTIPRWLSYTKL